MAGVADFSIEQPQRVGIVFGTMTYTAYYAEVSLIEPAPKIISKLWNISYAFDKYTWLAFFITYLCVSSSLFAAAYSLHTKRKIVRILL